MVFYTSELMLYDREYLQTTLRNDSSVSTEYCKVSNAWNHRVTDTDEVYILGGAGDLKYISGLNGIKHLLMAESDIKDARKYLGLSETESISDMQRELYEKYLREEYKINSINFHGRIIKRSCYGRMLRLCVDPTKRNESMFNLFGSVGEVQKVVKDGMNVNLYVNGYVPVSEVEIEYYAKRLGSLI